MLFHSNFEGVISLKSHRYSNFSHPQRKEMKRGIKLINSRLSTQLLKVITVGHPTLRKVAEPYDPEHIKLPKTQKLFKSMFATMEKQDGAGLAAPQVNVSKQLVVAHIPTKENPFPETALFNPKIETHGSERFTIWESCLSIPGLCFRVSRPAEITLSFLDKDAQQRALRASGIYACILQHECDHLFGKLAIDFLPLQPEAMQTLTTTKEAKRLFEQYPLTEEGSWHWIQ